MFADGISLAPALKMGRPQGSISKHTKPHGFAHGTKLRTIFGLRRVEDLQPGDILLDSASRIVELRSINTITADASHLVKIDPSAFGLGLGSACLHGTLIVGAGQHLAVRDWRTVLLYNNVAVVAAHRLVDHLHVHDCSAAIPLVQLGLCRDTLLHANGLLARVERLRLQTAQNAR